MLRVGVDVGGTNTDAVVMEGSHVHGACKCPTTGDVMTGIRLAVEGAMKQSGVDHTRVKAVMIGTTHFLNALLQRRDLQKVAILRLCGPSTRAVPPLEDWPEDLKACVEGHTEFLPGGYQTDGKTVIMELDEGALVAATECIRRKGLRAIAVTGVFSPVNPDQENRANSILLRELPNAAITLSHATGRIGLIERENAAVMNACLHDLAERTLAAFRRSLTTMGFKCPLYLMQNDGTLLSANQAEKLPILTFSSGATNSMRGAAFLTGRKNAIVVDVGGTTTDIGCIVKGFPREASTDIEVAGVRTSFRMPDVYSIALGGGSHVTSDGNRVGPVSVGYELTKKALCFGGDVLTTSDIAVAADMADFGNKSLVKHLDESMVKRVVDQIGQMVEGGIDRVKLQKGDEYVVLVGGGSILLKKTLAGAIEVTRPKLFDCANAVGAAIAQVSGELDELVHLEGFTREKAILDAKAKVTARAIENGAVPGTVHIVDVEDQKIAYIPGDVFRIRVRAVGDLDLECTQGAPDAPDAPDSSNKADVTNPVVPPPTGEITAPPSEDASNPSVCPPLPTPVREKPTLPLPNVDENGWHLTPLDVECITIGAAILGTGGGGSPYLGKLRAIRDLREGRHLRVVPPEYVKHGETVLCSAMLGAPTVSVEKIFKGTECINAICAIKERLDTEVVGVISIEMGGANSTEPMLTAGLLDVPIIDADSMGRAFPEVQMTTWSVNGMGCKPAAMCDEFGNVDLFLSPETPLDLEKQMRESVIRMGMVGGVCLPPVPEEFVRKYSTKYTMSQAWRIGRRSMLARAHTMDPIKAVYAPEGGQLLFVGKITLVKRDSEGAFARGYVEIQGLDEYSGLTLFVDIQNENLIARVCHPGQERKDGRVLASVPDLITIMDRETGRPIPTEEARYGFRVSVIGLPCHPLWRSKKALEVVGPRYFGYPIEWCPLGEYVIPRPVALWKDGKIVLGEMDDAV